MAPSEAAWNSSRVTTAGNIRIRGVQTQWRRIAAGLLLFGISFGYVEAGVVVYLRTLYASLREQADPARAPGELFPLITRDQLRATGPQTTRLVRVEAIREFATLLMLAGVALVAVGNRQLWLPAFAVAFGTWDLFFYVFLKLLIDWPASLLTWDILFLIPVPWAAPVLAPVIVSLSIIAGGLIALRRAVRMRPLHWIGITLGGLLIVLSFMWDFRNIMAGGLPHPFAWPLFIAGEFVGMGAFLHAVRNKAPL
jgi:hypothetical protein